MGIRRSIVLKRSCIQGASEIKLMKMDITVATLTKPPMEVMLHIYSDAGSGTAVNTGNQRGSILDSRSFNQVSLFNFMINL